MVTAIHQGRGSLVFITILVPYRSKTQPDIQIITDPETILAGIDPAELTVKVDGNKFTLKRDI